LGSSPLHFSTQATDLLAQGFVLGGLALQKTHCVARLLGDAFRRQYVQVGALVLAVAEIVGFDQAAVDQRTQQIVDLPDADAELFRQAALRDLRVALELAQDAVMLLFRKTPVCSTVEQARV